MPNKEYIVTKLEKRDKSWSEFLDKSIEKALRNNSESSKALLGFYTTLKIAIWQHLNSNLEKIITDIHKEYDQLKSSHIVRKSTKAQSHALTVAIPTDIDGGSFADSATPPQLKHMTGSKNDLSWLEQHTSVLSEVIEQMFDPEQLQSLKANLTNCGAPRMIATLVSGYLVNAMQANLTPLGILKCAKLYSLAAVRVIVEKQLGSKGSLTDYHVLIKFLAKARINKDKVMPQLVEVMIKSAQIGNPYTRVKDKRYTLIRKTITSSKAFTKYGITSTVFKSRAEFLQFANTKNSTLLFSSASCLFLKREHLLTQYFQLKDVPTFLSAELFFTKATADYGDAQSQFNYGVDIFVMDKTAAGLNLADNYWLLAAQQGIVAAKQNHELFLANTNNSNRDKENILTTNASNIEVELPRFKAQDDDDDIPTTITVTASLHPVPLATEPFRYKAQDDDTSTITVPVLLPPVPLVIDKPSQKLNLKNKTIAVPYDLRKDSERRRVVSLKTRHASSSMSQHGAYPIGTKIVKRQARSYKKNRDVQLLRHITTQLYGFCRTNYADAMEVQAMYYENSLYIATNVINAARLIADELNNVQTMKEALTCAYSCGNNSKREISKRHAHKIRTRVYASFDFRNERANIIKALLNSNLLKFKTLDISNLNSNGRSFKHEPNTIYVITNRLQVPISHAEEDLMDVLEAIYKTDDSLHEKPLIYGKRRPCFCCYSRLDSLQDENGPYVEFNPNPGLFFEAAFYSQSHVAATETFLRLSTVSTIYESADDAGYNTLSDSGGEGYNKMRIRS